jgi:hypothetical protein
VTSFPGVTFIFAVQIGNDNTIAKRGLSIRQAAGGFVGGAGPVNPDTCTDASAFSLVDGQLTSGGAVVATDPGVAYSPLVVGDGTITTTFTFVDGTLGWYNDAFSGGVAGICQTADGQVYFTFTAAGGPAGCTAVTLVVYEGKPRPVPCRVVFLSSSRQGHVAD